SRRSLNIEPASNLPAIPTRRSSDLPTTDHRSLTTDHRPPTTDHRPRRPRPRPAGSGAASRSDRAALTAGEVRSAARAASRSGERSEEHTSELQSLCNLVCRLLLEKKRTDCRLEFTAGHDSGAPEHHRHYQG